MTGRATAPALPSLAIEAESGRIVEIWPDRPRAAERPRRAEEAAPSRTGDR